MTFTFINSSNTGKLDYFKYFTGNSTAASQFDNARGIAIDNKENLYVSAYYKNDNNGYTDYIFKNDLFGNTLWQKINASATSTVSNGGAFSIALDSSNNIYIGSSYKNTANGTDALLTKYNSSGTLQWQRMLTYSTPVLSNQLSSIRSVTVDANNDIVICGYMSSSNTTNYTNGFLAKYDSSGNILWKRTISFTTNFIGMLKVCCDLSNNIFAITAATDSSANFNAYLFKYNSSGTLQWQKGLSFNSVASGSRSTGVGDIVLDSSGNIYISGYSKVIASPITNKAWIVKYNSSGTVLWQRFIANPNLSIVSHGISIDNLNNLYISGRFKNASNGFNIFLAKYDSSGNIQWKRSISDSNTAATQNENLNSPYTIKVSSNKKIYMCGQFKNTSGGSNGFVLRLPNNGSKTQTITFDASRALTYAVDSYLSDEIGTLTEFTGAFTDSAGSYVDYAGIALDNSASLTNSRIIY